MVIAAVFAAAPLTWDGKRSFENTLEKARFPVVILELKANKCSSPKPLDAFCRGFY